jgi:uncharacterized protein YkwD
MYSGCRTTVIVLVALALSGALLVPAGAAAPATRYADAAFAATNKHRAAEHRAELREGACVTGFAERWSRHMARTGRLVHQELGPIARRCGLRMAGENIAVGYPTGRAVVNRGWMHSEGHRENILRPSYRLMGIGATRDRNGRWWVSQVFGRH